MTILELRGWDVISLFLEDAVSMGEGVTSKKLCSEKVTDITQAKEVTWRPGYQHSFGIP